jgi:hypothetical protein
VSFRGLKHASGDGSLALAPWPLTPSSLGGLYRWREANPLMRSEDEDVGMQGAWAMCLVA